jgi:hypothetical protein
LALRDIARPAGFDLSLVGPAAQYRGFARLNKIDASIWTQVRLEILIRGEEDRKIKNAGQEGREKGRTEPQDSGT